MGTKLSSLNLSLLTLGGTPSSLPPNYWHGGRCWWWCHVLLRFSFFKKIKPTTKQKLSTSQICPLRKGSKAVLNHGHWCHCCHLDVGLVILVVGGGKKLSRGSFHAIPFLLQLFQTFQLPARQSQNVSAQNAKWTCFIKITPLISPSLGPCLVRGNDYEACHLGLSWWSEEETTHGFPAALPVEQRVQKQRILKNNGKKRMK